MADATTLKIALAQVEPDARRYRRQCRQAEATSAGEAAAQGADLVVYPELFVTGYPPEDLVLKPAFPAAARARVEALAARLGPGPAVLTGTVWPDGGKVYNAVALLDDGRVAAVRFKVDLPNYGVFDEKRVFDAGSAAGADQFSRRAARRADLRGHLEAGRARVPRRDAAPRSCIVPNGSPFDWTKPDVRMNIAVGARRESGTAAGLRQSGRRAGRAGVRRRLVRAQCRRGARRAAAGLGGEAVVSPNGRKDAERLALRDRACAPRSMRVTLRPIRPACWACAIMSGKNGFPGVVLGLVGRYRLARWLPPWPSTRWGRSACTAS